MEGSKLLNLYKEATALVDAGLLVNVLPKIRELVILCKQEKKDEQLVDIYLMQMQVLQFMTEHKAALNVYNEAKGLVERVFGAKSIHMANLLFMQSVALGGLDKHDRACDANEKSMEICGNTPGCTDLFVRGSLHMARLFLRKKEYEKVLQHTNLLSQTIETDTPTYVILMDLTSSAWEHLGHFEKAMKGRSLHLHLCKSIFGEEHVYYGYGLYDTANLLAQLNQFTLAFPMMHRAANILEKALGKAHEDVVNAREMVHCLKRGLVDLNVKKRFVKTTLRMCNHIDCNRIEDAMERCVWCKAHYLCSEHRGEIEKHTYLCPKFPDQADLAKCRRCCANTHLMQCSLCNAVSYCTKECQRDDWNRHKQFCAGKSK